MSDVMRNIRIEKLTLNMGTGKEQEKLERSVKLLAKITGMSPVKCITKKRIPTWGVRPGLPIGCKVTVRRSDDLLKRLLVARENKLQESCFDEHGNVNFGLVEYIYIPGVKYDPEIGNLGLDVCVTLERPGFRVKRRKLLRGELSKNHVISKEEAIDFFKQVYKVEVS
ncbi:MAG: 50S ribosomal protein L5 [Candidatus Woesearchaeota archaeon]